MGDASAQPSKTPSAAAGKPAPRPLRRTLLYTRAQLLRALPKHLLLAVVAGLIAGPLLYLCLLIPLQGAWRMALLFPMIAIYANAVTLPVAIPGRHWSFAFVCSVLLLFLMVVSQVLAGKLSFGHAQVGTAVLSTVNRITAGAIASGLCLGLFYGLLAGKRNAMIVGGAMGVATGYLLGLVSVQLVHASGPDVNALIYSGIVDYAWQFAAGLAVLHLGSGLGAALGAGATND